MSSTHQQVEPSDTPQDTDQKQPQAPDDLTDFRSVEHHNPGNGMWRDFTSEIRLDERWESQLADENMYGYV